MKYFVLAGEKSGDMHAANLCSELKKADPKAEMYGWGGDLMEEAGVKVLKNYSELAFMGFLEVIENLFTILGFLKLAKKQISEISPDVIVLVDYAGFNLKVAKWAKNNGFKIVYYIAPKAWAWRASRANILKKYVDLLLVIFPFEKDFFEKYGINTKFVGNPLFDEINKFEPNNAFKEKLNAENKPIIALLPGSRKQEIENMMALMSEISIQHPEYLWVLAGVSNFEDEFYKKFGGNFQIIKGQTYDLLHVAKAAIVTSGTATLETALFNVPQVVVYKTSAFSYQIAKAVVNIKFISLVNLVGEKEVVKELIQGDYCLEKVNLEFQKLISDNNFRENQLIEYKNIKNKLGGIGASKQAALEILNLN